MRGLIRKGQYSVISVAYLLCDSRCEMPLWTASCGPQRAETTNIVNPKRDGRSMSLAEKSAELAFNFEIGIVEEIEQVFASLYGQWICEIRQ